MSCRAASLLLFWCLSSSALAAPDLRAWLDDEIPARLAAADVPAAIVAVVHGNETIIAGYGVDAEQAVFRVGSVSKPVAASVVLALASRGVLDLHEDIRADLASLPVQPPLTRTLTVHHLLTHTAGFNERLFGQHATTPDTLLPLDGYLRRHLPPRFIEAGEVIAYNDHHTALAGWLAERRSGESFAALARQLIFEPLGMRDSSFEQVALPAHLSQRLATAYAGIDGPSYGRDYVALPPAAGLYTTAPDMARYLRGLLSRQLPDSERQLKVQFRPHARLPGRSYGFAEGRHGGMTYLYKDGQASGFNARLLIAPDEQFGLFVAHNRTIFGPFGRVEPAGRLLRQIGSDLLAALWPIATADPAGERDALPVTIAASDLSPYAGTYRTVIAARHTWERLASLFDEAVVTHDGGELLLGSARYRPAGDGAFVRGNDPTSAIAFRTRDGRVTHLLVGGGAYERVSWWTGQAALPWTVGLPLLVLLVSAWRLRRMDTWRVAIGQLALAAFFVGLVVILGRVDVQRLFAGPPPALLALLALPLVSLVGFILQLPRLGQPGRAWRAAGLLAAAALMAWLSYWNLLGYQLG